MEDGQEKAGASASNRLWLIISAIIAVTLVAVLLVPEGKEQAEDIPLPTASGKAEEPVPAMAETAVKEAGTAERVSATASEETPPAETSQDEGEGARQFLAENPGVDGETLFEYAQVFRQEGRIADAWLLYFKAARDGHAGAALALGEQADPAFFDAGRSMFEAPDLVQAHKWYELARRNGSTEAVARLDQLMQRLAAAARDGDREAEVLLAKWK